MKLPSIDIQACKKKSDIKEAVSASLVKVGMLSEGAEAKVDVTDSKNTEKQRKLELQYDIQIEIKTVRVWCWNPFERTGS